MYSVMQTKKEKGISEKFSTGVDNRLKFIGSERGEELQDRLQIPDLYIYTFIYM